MQLNLGSLFNIVWNINFLLKRLLWKIHQTSQNQWLPYRKNPGEESAEIASCVPLLLVFLCLIACQLAEINGSLYTIEERRCGPNCKLSVLWMWIKHFIVVPSACAPKVPLGSEFQRTPFSKALIQNRHRWQLYYFCTFRCTHICLYLSQLYMPICCNY